MMTKTTRSFVRGSYLLTQFAVSGQLDCGRNCGSYPDLIANHMLTWPHHSILHPVNPGSHKGSPTDWTLAAMPEGIISLGGGVEGQNEGG